MVGNLIENPIAMRKIDLIGSGKITIVIGAPYSVDKSEVEFWCPYQILGLGKEKIKRGIGIDTFQAICMTLYSIGNDLYFSEEYQEGKLVWDGGMTFADLGIPISEGMLEHVRQAKSRVDALKQK